METFAIDGAWLADVSLTWCARCLLAKVKEVAPGYIKDEYFKGLGFTKFELERSWKLLVKGGYLTRVFDHVKHCPFISMSTPIKTGALDTSNERDEKDKRETEKETEREKKERTKERKEKGKEKGKEKTGKGEKGYMGAQRFLKPESADEIVGIFESTVESLKGKHPQIQNMNIQLEAESFFTYYEERDWKDVKNLKLRIRTWCLNYLRFKTHDIKPVVNSSIPDEVMDFILGDDNTNVIDAQFEIVNDFNKLEMIK